MQRRRITKEDGRYLIFYTFEDEFASLDDSEKDRHPDEKETDEPEGEKTDV